MDKLRFVFCSFLILQIFSVSAQPQTPVEVFSKSHQYNKVTISPGGDFIASRVYSNGYWGLITYNLKTGKVQKFVTPDGLFGDIRDYHWIGGDKLVFEFYQPARGWRDYLVSASSSDTTFMETYEVGRSALESYLDERVRESRWSFYWTLEDSLPAEADAIYLSLRAKHFARNGNLKKTISLLIRYRPIKETFKTLAAAEGYVEQWYYDNKHNVVMNEQFDGKHRILQIPTNENATSWKELLKTDKFKPDDINPLFYDNASGNIWVRSPKTEHTEKQAMYLMDLQTAELSSPVLQDPNFDISPSFMLHPETRELISVTYEAEKKAFHHFDEGLAKVQRMLDSAFPDTENRIVSVDNSLSNLVILSTSDTNPGAFYLFNRQQKQIEKLFDAASWLKPEEMATAEFVEFNARDGMQLNGYLTMPLTSRNSIKPPVVMLVHGGPHIRDTWSFDLDAQFLARLGYAVFQPNFRLSKGFGYNYHSAGHKEYGRKAVSDVVDALQWLRSTGNVDESRACVMGGSYGGFSTVANLAFHPDVFACGIAFAGFADLGAMLEDDSDNEFYGLIMEMMGDPEKDSDIIKQQSPINYVEDIQAPLLVLHGEDDKRVLFYHAEALVEKLVEHNKKHKFVIFRDQGHGIHNDSTRKKYFSEIQRFLTDNLPLESSQGSTEAAK